MWVFFLEQQTELHVTVVEKGAFKATTGSS